MTLQSQYFSVSVGFTPLPERWFHALRDIEIETSNNRAAIFRMHFDLSRNPVGDFDAPIELFHPLTPVTIRLSVGAGLPLTLINGFVKDARLSVSNTPGATTFEVVCMDRLGTLMTHVEVPFSWPNMSDALIVTAIFGRYGMVPLVVPTPQLRTQLDTTTTQRGSHAAFLQQLAGRHGYALYVQPDPITGADVGHFHPPLIPLPPQGVLSIDFGADTNLTSFSVSDDMLAPTGVFGMKTENRTRVPVPIIAPVAAEPPLGAVPTLPRILPPPVEAPYDTDAASVAEAYVKAFTKATQSSRSVRASAEVDGVKYARPIFVGAPIMVRGAGRQHSGLYQVDRVTHRLTRDDYTQSVSMWRNAVQLTGQEIFVDPLSAA